MALLKSPTRDVMGSLLKNVSNLKKEKNPKKRIEIYEKLSLLVVKSSLKSVEPYDDSLHSVAIPIALQDVSSTNDGLVLAALSFLGGLLQVVNLPLEKQALVVDVITEKLSKVSEKTQSRKLMWSLANVQFDNQLQNSHLTKMLNAACMFLLEKTPVYSLSTVLESLNALRNIGVRRREFFEKNLTDVLSAVIPWLFNDADRIREHSLTCLEPFITSIAEQKLLNLEFQNQLRTKYYGILTQLVGSESTDCLKIWSFLIQAFGTELHDSVSLLNELLKIEETALKCKNPVFRQRALEHWKYIIDCFALNSSVLNNPKRIKLALVPLKSTDTRTVDFSKTKIELWWYLLDRLGPNAVSRFREVGLPLLTFCFGNADENHPSKGTALVFSDILPLATTVLAGIISSEKEFKPSSLENALISRSSPFLDSEDFALSVNYFSDLCLLTLRLKSATDKSMAYGIILRSFIERCCSSELTEPLQAFIHSLFVAVTTKPDLMETAFDAISGALCFDHLVDQLKKNLALLLQYFVDNEPLPVHPLVRFLQKIFEVGITWNVAEFTSSFVQNLQSLNNVQEKESISAVAELWSKFASALVAKNHCIHLPSADPQLLLLPLKWSSIESDESIFLPWSSLLSTWAKIDSSIMTSVLNPGGIEEVEVEVNTVRSVLSSIRSELSSYFAELSSWIKRWITSWLKLANVAENRSKCTDLLVAFLSVIIDELKQEENADLLLVEVKSCLHALTLSKEVSEILNRIFGPATTASKTTNVQLLRKNTSVCKLFSPLVPKNTVGRPKKSKTVEEFVVVPPAETTKRVLTDHQKEVMRSKRRTSCVPAMYNDLSQSSQDTDSVSMSLDAQSSGIPVLIVSCVSLAKEEDAQLEPPVVMQQSEILNEITIRDNGPPTSGTSQHETNATDTILQTDVKLRSQVIIEVPTIEKPITRRSSLRSSALMGSPPTVASDSQSSSSAEESNFKFQRPGPASKKAGFALKKQVFKKAKAAVEIEKELRKECVITEKLEPVDENPDKENGLIDSQTTRTLPSLSPRRVSLQPIVVDMQEESPPSLLPVSPAVTKSAEVSDTISVEEDKTADSQQVVDVIEDDKQFQADNNSVSKLLVQTKNDENLPADTDVTPKTKEMELEPSLSSEKLKEDAPPFNAEPNADSIKGDTGENESQETAKQITINAEEQALEETNAENVVSETSEQKKTVQDETLVLENNNHEVLNSSPQSATLPQKAPFHYKSLMKSFGVRPKKVVPPKSIGPTGKRGAQILEMSRKIQNEPPSKKSRKVESPPKETVPIESANIGSGAIGELVITPNGSPARTTQWVPRTYSPYASPSMGILKKRPHVDDSEDAAEGPYSPASSASKSRRVSFADPEVSHSVKISPIKTRLSRERTRRSLITTYDSSLSNEEPSAKEESEPPKSVQEPIDVSEKLPLNESTSSSKKCLPDEPADEINSPGLTVEKDTTPSKTTEEDETLRYVENETTLKIIEEEDSMKTAIFPSAVDCDDSLAVIVDRVTSPTSKSRIMAVLNKLGVRTIGNFCALSEKDIKGLDFQLPHHETMKQFLEQYFTRKLAMNSASELSLDNNEGSRKTDSSKTQTVDSELDIQSLDAKSDELITSSNEVKTEELTKSPDSLPNGQIITDSLEVPLSCPSSLDNKNSRSVLASPETPEDSEESTDVIMDSVSELHEPTVSLPVNKHVATTSAPITRPDVNVDEIRNLSPEDIVNIIELHPLKDDIISLIARKYVSLSFTVNGKVFPMSNNF